MMKDKKISEIPNNRKNTSVKLNCNQCGVEFSRTKGHLNYNEKTKSPHFCSRSCQTTYRNKSVLTETSPYKVYIKNITHRRKSIESNVDENYLLEVFKLQKGTCPYLNVKLIHGSKAKRAKSIGLIHGASLDRIDSSKGYIKGNVQFVSFGINMAKHNYSNSDFIKFLEFIKTAEDRIPYEKSNIVQNIEKIITF